jgi:AcrR family transcriptional regulator
MARTATLSDEEILRRARAVFALRGYAARTCEVAAAVGLTWGAIIRRFQDKRSLFDLAMAPPFEAAPQLQDDGLSVLLEQLHDHLRRQWPLQLHRRLAAVANVDVRSGLRYDLARAIFAHAGQGEVRNDLNPAVLAGLVLDLLTGDIAQRFVDGHLETAPDPLFIGRLLRLLSPRLEVPHHGQASMSESIPPDRR